MTAQPKRRQIAEPRGLLTTLLDHVDQGICVIDVNLKVVACNATFLELLGYPDQLGLPGTSLSEFIRCDAERGVRAPIDIAHLLGERLGGPDPAKPRVIDRAGPDGQPLKLTTVPLPDGGFAQICSSTDAAAALASVRTELRRHRDYAEAASDWFWETDPELRFTRLGGPLSGTLKGTGEGAVGASLEELVEQGLVASKHHAACREAMAARKPFRDVRYAVRDLERPDAPLISLSGRPVFDLDGRFSGYRGSARDVTGEGAALRRDPKARLDLEAAIEAFSEGLALFDANDRLVFSNRRFLSFYEPIIDRIVPGIPFVDLLRLMIEAGLFATEGQDPQAVVNQHLDLHRHPGLSLEVRLKDGRWLRVSDRRTADGGIVSVRTDITELKRRESSLTRLSNDMRTQMMRFDAALNNMVQGLCMFDAEQRLIVCNDRYLQIYRFSPEVVKPGITLREIMEYSVALGNYRREDAERAIAERPSHATRREQSTLLQYLNDGRVIAVMHQPMADGGSVATYEDVTQTVRAEEALREYAAKLERSNLELQDFASVASHDLQEPLRKIEAFGDRLKSKCADQLSESGQMYVERMQNAAGRMRSLINDLLSYSRVTTKAQPFAVVDLNVIASEVVNDLQVSIEQASARIEIEPLPPLEADATQLRQLLQNLLSNALKFRRPGDVPVVRVSGKVIEPASPGEPPPWCEIHIADNGIGFEQKYADRIFGIFQRLHGRNEYEGTGIGLATCRKIVERHGGTIRAVSAPGEGATFIATLPLRQPSGDSPT